jgi:hypothetical protein
MARGGHRRREADLANYDVIIIQESISGGASVLMPSGPLALKSIPKPFIYNKCYALQKSRALTGTTSTGAPKEADGITAGTLSITETTRTYRTIYLKDVRL